MRYNINQLLQEKEEMNYLSYYASLGRWGAQGKDENQTPSETHHLMQNMQKYQLWRRLQYLEQRCIQLQMENQTLKNGQLHDNRIHIRVEVVQKKQSQNQQNKFQKQTQSQLPKKGVRIIKKRRTEKELTKNFNCPYFGCQRDYASALALNLHMRVKHGGGTKKQRKQLLKNIIDAQLNGQELPEINLNLPPNYLEEKKKLILSCEEYYKPEIHKSQS